MKQIGHIYNVNEFVFPPFSSFVRLECQNGKNHVYRDEKFCFSDEPKTAFLSASRIDRRIPNHYNYRLFTDSMETSRLE
jgi:hypothetical protein